ncbi:MAG: tetratricopeptide repeat protein [Planctomycetes bacterium]|nr:tetratricopeptide repeat protein [Planctomycetota bacterium]
MVSPPRNPPSGANRAHGEPGATPLRQNLVRLGAVLVCAILLFAGPASRAGFALDDRETILENPLVSGQRPALQAFGQDYWHHRGDAGLYRPLVTLSLRWNRQWLGDAPAGFHGVNVLLHLAVLAWAGVILALLSPKRRVPWWALAVFSLHPIQSEAVVWIAGRSSSLCALFGLMPLGLYLAQSASRTVPRSMLAVWAFMGTLLPLLAKEDGLAFAALWWFLPLGFPLARRVSVACALLVVMALRTWALGGLGLDGSRGALAGLGILERIPLGLGVLGQGLTSLLWPAIGLQDVNGQGRVWQAVGLLVLLALLGALIFTLRSNSPAKRSRTIAGAGLAALALALLPWLQWIPGPELFGPRFLYLPLLFGVFALSATEPSRGSNPLPCAALLVGLTLGLRPVVAAQSLGFENPVAFWTQRTIQRTADARSWNGLANALLAQEPMTPGATRAARSHFVRAIQLDPNYSRPHVGLALLARQAERPQEERDHLAAALRLAPQNPIAWANLGSLHLRAKRPLEALEAYKMATQLQPGRAVLWRGLARAHAALDHPIEAQSAIRKALALDPSDPRTQAWSQRIEPH